MTDYYYKILELDRKATKDDIIFNFKRLSKKYHPLNSKIDMATNAQQFASVCEAFEVLSNPEYKAIFDAYGEKVLKHGFEPEKNMNFTGIYQWKGNSHEIFNAYFDTGEEFKDKPIEHETNFYGHFGVELEEHKAKLAESKLHPKPRDLETTIECNLQDFLTDTQIKDILLKGIDIDLKKEVLESIDLYQLIDIPKDADSTKPFQFSLQKMLINHPDEVKALACKYLSIPVNIINSKTVIKIKNEGIPFVEKVQVDDPDSIENEGKKTVEINKRGDLYVKFNIKFPEDLSFDKREKIVKILKNEDE